MQAWRMAKDSKSGSFKEELVCHCEESDDEAIFITRTSPKNRHARRYNLPVPLMYPRNKRCKS